MGNADAIIHGKGKYKGTRTVSFIIRRGISAAEWDAEIEAEQAAKAEEAKAKKAAAKKAKGKKADEAKPKAVEEKPVEPKTESKVAKKAKAADD
jgi:hypothetical protein